MMLEVQDGADVVPHREAHGAGALNPLDDKQAGHLRRIADLGARLPDDWSGMLGRTTMQEDFGGLRFQLAYMSYALALAHVHRLPAAPAMFKVTFQRLIEKMLSPDVWSYWHYVSTGDGPFNKSLGKLPAQWNPVGIDNIMYSAYVQSMVLLYHYLFRDDRYAQPGALTFSLPSLFWSGSPPFAYDEKSLNQHLYWMMVEKGYLGIACEPNCVFQICNQPAILGFRMHDLVYGGDMATEVTEGYKRAWAEFGIADGDGHFNIMALEKEHQLFVRPAVASGDFWLGSLMNAWNPDFVKNLYPAQMKHWSRPGPEGTLWIEPYVSAHPVLGKITSAQDLGWGAICASEMGDENTLERLLAYADRQLTPAWEDGAYFYRRRDSWFDADGLPAAMDPHTGNALLAYARLNVTDGLRKLYGNPMDDAHFAQPALVEMPEELDLRTARYTPEQARLAIAGRRGRCRSGPVALVFSNVWGRGAWSLRIDGALLCSGDGERLVGNSSSGAERQGDRLLIRFDPAAAFRIELEWRA